MGFRISTSQQFSQLTNAILRKQSDIANTQLQLATGNRLTRPSDDPVAAIDVTQINSSLRTTSQYIENGAIAQSRLRLAESTLDGVTNSIQRVRELAVFASNGVQSNESLRAIAQEVRQQFENVFDLANTRDASNEQLFAGNRTRQQAFVKDGLGNVSYQGDSERRLLQVGSLRQIPTNEPGDRLFMNVPDGNGSFAAFDDINNTGGAILGAGTITDPSALDLDQFRYEVEFTNNNGAVTFDVRKFDAVSGVEVGAPYLDDQPLAQGGEIQFDGVSLLVTGSPDTGDRFDLRASENQSVFRTYQNILDTLESGDVSTSEGRARVVNQLGESLSALDQGLDRLVDARTDFGTRGKAIDDQVNILKDLELDLSERLSSVEDVNYAETISEFTLQQTSFQAALQSFGPVANLSLFNFLR
jgi:flagellar hook-associated protein 3 FlgL